LITIKCLYYTLKCIISISFVSGCRHILTEIKENLPDIILDSFFLIIAILLIIFIGFIFFLLGKVPLFRWIGITVITIIKYTLISIFNILAIGVLSGMAALGVAILLALFHYLDWELFMIGNEILIINHSAFFIASFLMGLCFVIGILFGTLIFSFVSLSTRKYMITSYATGVILFVLLLPTVLKFFTPEVEATFLGMIVICTILPVLGLIFAIGTAQKRKERRRRMTKREREIEDSEEKRKENFNNSVIFPWIRTQSR